MDERSEQPSCNSSIIIVAYPFEPNALQTPSTPPLPADTPSGLYAETGGMSMSQESMLYIPPVEGATTSRFNRKKSAISEYLNKSIQLHVNLKSTSH